MNLRETVVKAMSDLFTASDTDDGVLITVPCLYPGNGFVQVHVAGGPNEYRVSDGGGALREIESTGVEPERDPVKALRSVVMSQGLQFKGGAIYAPMIGSDRLASAIAIVANASKDAAEWFYTNTRINRRKNFKQLVRALLQKTFEPEQVAPTVIQGASSKAHNFDMVIELGGGRKLAVDAVVHDGNSINSAVATNVDVKQRGDPNIIQRIVYDDEDDWVASDLNLLALGGTLLPYSKSQDAFNKFTRRALL